MLRQAQQPDTLPVLAILRSTLRMTAALCDWEMLKQVQHDKGGTFHYAGEDSD
jgi:hypothetical protein